MTQKSRNQKIGSPIASFRALRLPVQVDEEQQAPRPGSDRANHGNADLKNLPTMTDLNIDGLWSKRFERPYRQCRLSEPDR